MSTFFDRLISRSRGELPTLEPRSRQPFESGLRETVGAPSEELIGARPLAAPRTSADQAHEQPRQRPGSTGSLEPSRPSRTVPPTAERNAGPPRQTLSSGAPDSSVRLLDPAPATDRPPTRSQDGERLDVRERLPSVRPTSDSTSETQTPRRATAADESPEGRPRLVEPALPRKAAARDLPPFRTETGSDAPVAGPAAAKESSEGRAERMERALLRETPDRGASRLRSPEIRALRPETNEGSGDRVDRTIGGLQPLRERASGPPGNPTPIESSISVTIGRIEVRASPPTDRPGARSPRVGPKRGLSDYLAERNEARRR